MRKAIYSMLVLAGLTVLSTNGWAKTTEAGEPAPEEPATCQEMIVELQNMLHAANQAIEALQNENRELRETLKRIRNEIDRGGGGYRPLIDNRAPQ